MYVLKLKACVKQFIEKSISISVLSNTSAFISYIELTSYLLAKYLAS